MDDIQKAVRTCLSKYADFNGRAARPEYWWFFLAVFVVNIITSIVMSIIPAISIVGTLIALALAVPGLAAGSRRLHDIGKSGWLQLLMIIPLVGLIVLYWAAQPGDANSNQYGPPPQDAPRSDAMSAAGR